MGNRPAPLVPNTSTPISSSNFRTSSGSRDVKEQKRLKKNAVNVEKEGEERRQGGGSTPDKTGGQSSAGERVGETKESDAAGLVPGADPDGGGQAGEGGGSPTPTPRSLHLVLIPTRRGERGAGMCWAPSPTMVHLTTRRGWPDVRKSG